MMKRFALASAVFAATAWMAAAPAQAQMQGQNWNYGSDRGSYGSQTGQSWSQRDRDWNQQRDRDAFNEGYRRGRDDERRFGDRQDQRRGYGSDRFGQGYGYGSDRFGQGSSDQQRWRDSGTGGGSGMSGSQGYGSQRFGSQGYGSSGSGYWNNWGAGGDRNRDRWDD